jgi:predicted site-specific integrase-resolvase
MTVTWLSIKNASILSGLDPQTLRKFADDGSIVSYRTPSQQRKFSKESLLKMMGSDTGGVADAEKKNYIYVSTPLQDEDLARKQLGSIYASNEEFIGFVVLTDLGASIDGIRVILDACADKCVGNVVIAHKDRLPRICFDTIKYMIERNGGSLIVGLGSGNEFAKSEDEITREISGIMRKFNVK